MKNEIRFLKVLSLIFASMLMNSINSQSPCPATIDFTNTGNSSTCYYVFTPDTANTPKHICSITWTSSSRGDYGVSCDPGEVSVFIWSHTFCFTGYYDVTMTVHFCDGTSCYVTHTIHVGCAGMPFCDPDPERDSIIPDPQVEITYISPDTCHFSRSLPVQGCMYSNAGAGIYYISCGWKWAIRVPATNCNYWNYYIRYDSINTCGSYTCVTRYIYDTNVVCIRAYIDHPIYIVATAHHCCLPDGYFRSYYWTPTPASGSPYTPIGDPTPTVSGLCSAYRGCPDYTYCVENPQTMSDTYGPAACFTGGNKSEQRSYLKSNLTREQHIKIFNIQGVEVYKGQWKFGNGTSPELIWPNGISSGIYLIKFENSKEMMKLYKFE